MNIIATKDITQKATTNENASKAATLIIPKVKRQATSKVKHKVTTNLLAVGTGIKVVFSTAKTIGTTCLKGHILHMAIASSITLAGIAGIIYWYYCSMPVWKRFLM